MSVTRVPATAVPRAHSRATTFFVRDKRTLCQLTDDHPGDERLALICPAPPGVQEELIGADDQRIFRPLYLATADGSACGWTSIRTPTRSPRSATRPTTMWHR